MTAQTVDQADGVVRIDDPDVDMQGEGRLAACELAHRAVDELVALARGDHRVVPQREGVKPRSGGAQVQRRERLVQGDSLVGQLADRRADSLVHAGGQLERRSVGLGADFAGQVGGQRRQDPVDLRRQRPVPGRQEHHLLLDAERVTHRPRAGTPFGPGRHA